MDFHLWAFEIITTIDFQQWAFESFTTKDWHLWAFSTHERFDSELRIASPFHRFGIQRFFNLVFKVHNSKLFIASIALSCSLHIHSCTLSTFLSRVISTPSISSKFLSLSHHVLGQKTLSFLVFHYNSFRSSHYLCFHLYFLHSLSLMKRGIFIDTIFCPLGTCYLVFVFLHLTIPCCTLKIHF